MSIRRQYGYGGTEGRYRDFAGEMALRYCGESGRIRWWLMKSRHTPAAQIKNAPKGGFKYLNF